MVFLNPAVLFGLLAASIPILIHLLNLKRLKKVEFSSLAFLKELQKSKIRRVKIKQWILLALRVLIILLLVASFARPTIERASLVGSASAAKTSAVFILDNSFSASVVDEKGSYLNQSKEIINLLLNDLQDGDEAALIVAPEDKTPNNEFSTDPDQLRKQLDLVEISYIKGDLNRAIEKAFDKISESGNYNKEIYVFSDFQASNFDAKLRKNYPASEDIRLYRFKFSGEKENKNLAVSSLVLNNQILEKDKNISFTALVSNSSDLPVKNNVASLFINDQRTAQQSISLQSGETASLTFETTLKQTGLLKTFVELEEDDIIQDNTRYVSLYVPDKIRVLILTDHTEDSNFIRLALGDNSEDGNISIESRDLSRSSSINFSEYEVIIIIGSRTEPNYKRLTQFTEAGGGIILFPGSNASFEYMRDLCEKLHFPVPEEFKSGESTADVWEEFGYIDFAHPILSDLYEDKNQRRTDSPKVFKYFRTSSQGRGKDIIKLGSNSLFMGEFTHGSGRLLLFTSAPALEWNNFPMKALFAPLMYKSIFYLATKISENRDRLAGEEIYISLGGKSNPRIRLEKPDGGEELLAVEYSGSNYRKFTGTGSPGLYKVYSGNELIDYFSINSDPLESRLDYMTMGEFSDYLSACNFQGNIIDISPHEDFKSKIYQSRFGTELWKYFLIAALIIALIEMSIARNTKKDLAEIQKNF